LSDAIAAFSPSNVLHFMWFFPFAVMAGAVVYWFDRFTRRVPLMVFVSTCTAIAGALLSSRLLYPPGETELPLGQWAFAVPAMFLGLAFGRLLASRQRERGSEAWAYVAMIAIVAAAFAARHGGVQDGLPPSDLFRYALVCSLLALGTIIPNTYDRFTKLLEPMLLGGYALHLIVHYQVTERIVRLVPTPTPRMIGLLGTYALTLALVALLRRTPIKRFL
jgi:surface polysaccharide O-acyltransferase-like enzyme